MIARSMTVEEFLEYRIELADGQWAELHAGEPFLTDPPTPEHGAVVMNLSRPLSAWIEQTRRGFACFHHGLIMSRQPDTLFCPAVSYFNGGNLWEELDRAATETCPALVIEILSGARQRQQMTGRVGQYLGWGVETVWVVDMNEAVVRVHTSAGQSTFRGSDIVAGYSGTSTASHREPLLDGFSITPDAIFHQPAW